MEVLRVVVIPRLGNKLARVDEGRVFVVDQGTDAANLELARKAVAEGYGDLAGACRVELNLRADDRRPAARDRRHRAEQARRASAAAPAQEPSTRRRPLPQPMNRRRPRRR